jgi:hypothetical protein
VVERLDPERYFAYRWHPCAIVPGVDYSKEPTTLVEFRLEDAAGGTVLTLTESGFDRIPLSRRAEAFRMNDNGWSEQLRTSSAMSRSRSATAAASGSGSWNRRGSKRHGDASIRFPINGTSRSAGSRRSSRRERPR